MTLLTIAQDTLRELPNFEVPDTIIGNANKTAVLSLALINRSLLETRKRSNWEQLAIPHTITTVTSQEEYALPSDYNRTIAVTWWDGTNQWPMRGPATPQRWEFLKTSIVSTGVRRWFRIFRESSGTARKVYIFPLPTNNTDEITFEYISDGLVVDTGATLHPKYQADDDVGLLDEDVVALGFKWRFLKTNGLPYVEEFRDYELAIEDLKGDNGGAIFNMDAGRRQFVVRTQEGNFPSV